MMGGMRPPRARKEEEKISYSLRLCVLLFDVSIASSFCVFPGVIFPGLAFLHQGLILIILLYYTWFDVTGTTSLAKRCLGVHLLTPEGDMPGPMRRGMRAFCRCIFPALAVFSWRRISLLDLSSGTRLTKTAAVPVNMKPKRVKRRFLEKKAPTPTRRAIH
jgi:hypothetical protein